MKIRQRLALRFTVITGLILGAILFFIFILTRGFVQADFAERLAQQSQLEVLHYATPNVPDVLTGPSLLVNPVTSIYSDQGTLLHAQGSYEIPQTWVNFLRENDVFNAERGAYTTIGRKYDIDGKRYLVFVSDKDLPGQHELDLLIKAISVGWVLGLLIAYLAGLYFSADALRPVKHVVNEVNQITKDNLGYRLRMEKDDASIDEIDELVITFNALLFRIENAFITQKRFVQHASHELKTPLTAIMAEAELALTRDRPLDEYKRTLRVITMETERLVRITQGLLTLARIEEGTFRSELSDLDLAAVVASTVNTFRQHHPAREIIFSETPDKALVNGNPQLLQIAVLNILDNAVKYSTGRINVAMHKDKGVYMLNIQDFGIGIPDNDQPRLRTPLFRATNVGDVQGAGLGLSLVDRIIKIHSGALRLSSKEQEGTTCTIVLPAIV